MGPNFEVGATRIGRNRLPPNYVAILDDPALLLAALRELHAYALTPVSVGVKTQQSIVFRVVDAAERGRFNYKLQQFLGAEQFMDHAAVFNVRDGHWHVVDSEHMTHVCNRHSDPERESKHGHIPVTALDFERIPDAVAVANVVEFAVTKGMPRIVYRKGYADGQLTVIQEIRSRGLTVKTMYKQK